MISTGNWKIGFYNVDNAPVASGVFGCATLGAVLPERYIDPDSEGFFVWKENVAGTVVSGTYAEVLREICVIKTCAKTCLIFLAAGRGAEALIDGVRTAFPGISIAGGVAANNGGKGELSPKAEDVVILFPEEGGYTTFEQNILNDTGKNFTVSTGEHPRIINTLDGREALPEWRKLQAEHAIAETCFERMTLSDRDDVNVHMNAQGGTLNAGANCADGMVYKLRYASQETLDNAAADFCNRENSLIVGCAGLKSAIKELPKTGKGSLVVFLFGEIAKNRFANLMMTGVDKK